MMRRLQQGVTALGSGILFGFGLGLSQMIDRERVLGFLDLVGDWDPSLLFVLGGAVTVTGILFRFVLRRPQPLWADRFQLPTQTDLDPQLVWGAALFGIGWGIGGYCPGPAIASLALGRWNPVVFVLAFLIGSLSCQGLLKWIQTSHPSTDLSRSPADSLSHIEEVS